MLFRSEAQGKPQNKNWQVGMNVSEPLPQSGTYYDEPKTGDAYADLKLPYSGVAPNFNYTFTNPFDDNPAYKGPLLNATNKVRTGTTTNFRTLFLQRLANPLLPWNPEPNDPQYGSYYDQNSEVNPYISIDCGTVDLTVFNGDESTNQKITAAGGGMEWIDPSDPDPYDNTEPLERFGTRPRGDKNQLGGNAAFDDRLWSPYAMAPQDSASRTADLDHIFIVVNAYNQTFKIAREALEALKTHYADYLLKSVVRQCTKFAQASSEGCPVFGYDPDSKGAKDIEAMQLEILGRIREGLGDRPDAARSAR
mgnify:CR=1 FL=1